MQDQALETKVETMHAMDNDLFAVSFWNKLRPFFELRQEWKKTGFRGCLKRYGWKFVAAFFVCYLVRDVLLYLLLPYLMARKIF